VNFRDWAKQPGRKVELALDCIGQKSLEDAWWCVKDGGILLSISQPPEQMKPTDFDGGKVHDIFFIMEPDGQSLAHVSKLIEEEKCKPILDSVFPLDKFEEAFAKLASGHSRGKIVIELMKQV
jgi:NADPH:quinone reductase-like Zn-dependent oxidoreductase